uniref:Uncharacterized protein n=1 Tax=Ceratitis capitata TaxID=7213 RepID=W8BT50_CERCA
MHLPPLTVPLMSVHTNVSFCHATRGSRVDRERARGVALVIIKVIVSGSMVGNQPTNLQNKYKIDENVQHTISSNNNCPLQYQNNSSSSVDSAAAKSRHHFCCTLMCSRRAALAAQTCSQNLLSTVRLYLNIRVHSCGHERLQQQQHS